MTCSPVAPTLFKQSPLGSSIFSSLLQKIDFPSMHFSHYVLGYEKKSDIPTDVKERTAWTFSCRATLELTQCVRQADTPSNAPWLPNWCVLLPLCWWCVYFCLTVTGAPSWTKSYRTTMGTKSRSALVRSLSTFISPWKNNQDLEKLSDYCETNIFVLYQSWLKSRQILIIVYCYRSYWYFCSWRRCCLQINWEGKGDVCKETGLRWVGNQTSEPIFFWLSFLIE